MIAAIVSILIGLIIMVSPELLDYNQHASYNNYIIGPLVITFAFTAIWEVNRSSRYVNVVFGIWQTLSPLILSFDDIPALINITTGASVIALSLMPRRITGRYGGGWRSLFQKDPPHWKAVKDK